MGSAARARARAQARTAAKVRGNANARNARQKLADRRAGARNRLLLAGGSVAVVIALVATLIAVKLSQPPAQAPQPLARAAQHRSSSRSPACRRQRSMRSAPEPRPGSIPSPASRRLPAAGNRNCSTWAASTARTARPNDGRSPPRSAGPASVRPQPHPLLARRRLRQYTHAVVRKRQLHQQVPGVRAGGVVRRGHRSQHAVRARLPAAADSAAASVLRPVRRRLDPVRRHREPLPPPAGPVSPFGTRGPQPGRRWQRRCAIRPARWPRTSTAPPT